MTISYDRRNITIPYGVCNKLLRLSYNRLVENVALQVRGICIYKHRRNNVHIRHPQYLQMYTFVVIVIVQHLFYGLVLKDGQFAMRTGST